MLVKLHDISWDYYKKLQSEMDQQFAEEIDRKMQMILDHNSAVI